MTPTRIRGLDFRAPAPEYEFADGTVVQTRYLDANGFALLGEYEADSTNAEKLVALLQYVAPSLTREYIDARVTIADIVQLIAIGKGHADVLLQALKNGVSVAADPLTTTPIPPSTTTIPSHASSPA